MDLRDLRAPTTLTQDLEEIAEKTASYGDSHAERSRVNRQATPATPPELAAMKRQYRLRWEQRIKALEREAR